MIMATPEECKLQLFLQWLQLNKVELRGCEIKYCDSSKGFGIFASSSHVSDGVILVVPLDLAITPMRVLQDPILGPECRAMFEEGEVDDRFLIILFLTLERLRKNSSWKPYLDILPTNFGNPLWFTDEELLELKGTALYRATELQKKKLQELYDSKVEILLKHLLLLDGCPESECCYTDFLWANSVFWTRALTIPFPHSYIFPDQWPENYIQAENISDAQLANVVKAHHVRGVTIGTKSSSEQGETIWVEGLVPGIDFCNHDLKVGTTWEVDGTGSTTGVPSSIYLFSVERPLEVEKEISISYGNKGNEELLYLYGFVIDNNPDDYLMLHYPVEALQGVPFPDAKHQLLEAQKVAMRCLLPRKLLDNGFFSVGSSEVEVRGDSGVNRLSSFSWSGQRGIPTYLNKLVFSDDFLSALRTIAMKEEELFQVSSMLEELVGSEGEREPTDTEVRAAVWETCGDSGAMQLLVDLLQTKMMDLEEGTGTEESDTKLLEKAEIVDCPETCPRKTSETNGCSRSMLLSRKKWSCIVYRRGQKQLTRLFLKEAEHALQLALDEGN